LKELEPRRLITVFGCGGDRDKGKRPLMAAAAARFSDGVVITSDNPRSEDPIRIIREIEQGLPKTCNFISVPDRAEAIDAAIRQSRSGDIILIAGKGHETDQQFADHTIDFDDRKKADLALRKRSEEIAEMRKSPDLRG
jgi:UDP-N-acetylmuramoyl-L-alanyl-D-glutamate--2,6-diaminopimelate ligase